MTLDEFKIALDSLRQSGFVKTLRRGPTGIGYTLEILLKLKENNLALPDIDQIELKSHRRGSYALITVFTFNREVWRVAPLDAIRRFGTPDKNPEKAGRLGLYVRLSVRGRTKTGLGLEVTDDLVTAKHFASGVVIAEWTMNSIIEQLFTKAPALLLVTAHREFRGDIEWFHYSHARLYEYPIREQIPLLLQESKAKIDLRLHDAGSVARNHGTGFRMSERYLSRLYKSVTEL